MCNSECLIRYGAAIIAAVLEDYVLYLRPLIPEIMVPDPAWYEKIVLHSIKTRFYPE